ncbi:hypothetical protein Syn7502_01257 [Synechococcus sp. PCC 7502]|nr:hypothetical protein Syn7502_01257 [Synechococcus sp. PCC 7502]
MPKTSVLMSAALGFINLAIAANPSYAVGINFSTWSSSGDVTTPSVGSANLSTDGLNSDDFPANNGTFSFTGTVPATDAFFSTTLQDFLGLSATSLDTSDFAYEGSALKFTFNANGGDKLTFDYNFLTNDLLNIDYSFLLVNGSVITLADVSNALNSSSFFANETGTTPFSYTFTKSGTYTVGLGVVDIGDNNVTSALKISNAELVTTTAVPFEFDPALGLGAMGAVWAFKQAKKKMAKR